MEVSEVVFVLVFMSSHRKETKGQVPLVQIRIRIRRHGESSGIHEGEESDEQILGRRVSTKDMPRQKCACFRQQKSCPGMRWLESLDGRGGRATEAKTREDIRLQACSP